MPQTKSTTKKNSTTSTTTKTHAHSEKCIPTKNIDDYSDTMRLEKPSTNPITAFAPKPQKVGFDSQLKEEQVVLLLRQHPITQVKQWLVIFAGIFMPQFIISSPLLSFLPPRFHLAFQVGWFLLIVGFALESFLKWFFNVYIITDERIIDVDFLSIVSSNISSAKIDKIEDITSEKGGVLASIIDYGNIKIQTAAEKQEFEFTAVPHPAKVTSLLNEMLVEEEREQIEGRVN